MAGLFFVEGWGISSMQKKFIIIAVMFLVVFSRREIRAACPEEYGVVSRRTPAYVAADSSSESIGWLDAGTPVDVVSFLDNYVLVKLQNGQYAYLSNRDLYIDAAYEKLYGEKEICQEDWSVLETEGQLYGHSTELLMESYMSIPENIRFRFEAEGFRIRMTEWDITKEAYAPYGGYHGAGKVRAVFDFERKMLYVNDEWPGAVVHEMGHYVNDTLGIFSNRGENRMLYETEAEKISNYAEENDREYFAEVFRLYVAEPQLLRLISPSSYQVVENAILCFGKSDGNI